MSVFNIIEIVLLGVAFIGFIFFLARPKNWEEPPADKKDKP